MTSPESTGDARYRLILEEAPDGVVVLDPTGRFTYVNRRAGAILGFDREALLGRRVDDLMSSDGPSDPPASASTMPGGTFVRERRITRGDGTNVVIESSGRVLADRTVISVVRDVTERKQAEAALEATERRLRATVTNAPIILFALDRSGVFILSEGRGLERLGLEPGQAVGSSVFDLFADVPDALAAIREALGGRPMTVDVHARGSWFETTFLPVVEADGSVGGVMGVATDVTEARRIRSELSESEERLARAQAIAQLGSWEWNIVTNDLAWSDEIFRIFGLTPREFAATYPAFLERIHPDDRGLVEEAVRRAVEEGGAYDIEHRIVRPDGSEALVHEQGEVTRDAAGRPVRMIGIVRDVTDRAVADRERERLISAVEQTADAVMITDPSGLIVFVNSAFERISGYSRDEVVGQTPRMLKSGHHPASMFTAMWGSLTAGEPWSGAVVNRRRDGSLYETEIVISPIRDRAGRIVSFVEVGRDMTAQRTLEERLAQAEKMEAVGRLAGGIAHDFNNLLTGILGYSQILAEEVEPDDPRRHDIAEIERAALRAAALVRQLLAFGRRQVLQPRIVDPNEVIRGVRAMLVRIIGEEVVVADNLDEGVGSVRVDPGQLEQVVLNLVVNARDAMPRGGTVTIETASVDLDEAYAEEHPEVTAGPYVMVAVRDTGVGMDAATRERIFDPFFTTKDPGKGTGLGLATVHGIVHQSGGHIWVYSEPGLGTTFKVYFPRVDGAMAPEEPVSPSSPPALGRETILLVEDEPSVRSLVERTLSRAGYTVVTAPGPREALAAAAQMGDTIDLLITDVVMPDMRGPQLATQIRRGRPGLRTLFMSGYSDDSLANGGLVDPGLVLMEKPFSPDALALRVREILDGR